MKKSKFITLILAVILAMTAMVLPVSAAGDGSIELTGTVKGKTYELFKIFDLEITGEEGSYLYEYKIASEYRAFFKSLLGEEVTDAQAAAYVAAMEDQGTDIAKFAEALKKYLLENKYTGMEVSGEDGTTLIENLDLGYYLIYPQGGISAICSLTSTAKDAEIAIKTDYPTIDKKIVEGSNRVVEGDYAIGDDISYELTSYIPDMVGYTDYTYIVRDTMSAGLTFDPSSVVITIGGNIIDPSIYTVVPKAEDVEEGKVTNIQITFKEFYNNYKNVKPGTPIVITYKAKLNEHAVIGKPGNPNSVTLEYSNDPHDETSTETTPESITKVFSFELDIVKIDAGTRKGLDGVKFSLWTTTPIAGVTPDTEKVSGLELYLINDKLESDTSGNIIQKGLKEGTYYLFEDKAKDGYHPLTEPIIFTLTAEKDGEGDFTGGVNSDNTLVIKREDSGIVDITIENKQGSLLPETGGIGTVILKIVGILIMVGAAAAFMITKKRKEV